MLQVKPADESSLRYAGWRVVAACFVAAVCCWGFGLYSHGIYLAELQRLHGWSASLISGASTAFYLLTAAVAVFISDAIARLGPRPVMLMGASCFASALALLALVGAVWQLYAVYLIMAVGAAALHVAAISNVLGLWFDRQRGLAISLALNGASSGGILVAPLLVLVIAEFGFARAMLGAAAVMAAVLVPAIVVWIDRPRAALAVLSVSPNRDAPGIASTWTRPRALRSFAFWSVAAPFALALTAQVGFLVHQIALLEPAMGRTGVAWAVLVLTIAAISGRIVFGMFIRRLDARRVAALSLAGQAAALLAMTQTTDTAALLAACAVFGLAAGNLITLPAIIIQREFEAASFGLLVALSTAIGQFTYAFGPGLLGVVRDATGGYTAPLVLCMVLEMTAAILVLARPKSCMAQQAPVDFR